jgi:guanylate kinase
VIAGPSGVGKGSVVQDLLARDPDRLTRSVSATTRPPRPAEVDGRDYLFVSTQEFEALVEDGAMLEWAEVFDNLYGTPADSVVQQRAAGRDMILEIDVQGAQQIRDRVPDAVLIFLEPPSLEELARRLRGRGTESEERIARRLQTAGWELEQRAGFDHVVVNDDLEHASSQVAAIIEASRSDPEDPFS